MADREIEHLIPGEQVISQFARTDLVLTNYRVRYDEGNFGTSQYCSIVLNDIASCGFTSESKPILLVLALVLLAFAPLAPQVFATIALVIGAVVLAIVYVATRKTMLTVESSGGQKIQTSSQGISRETVVAFVNQVILTKLQFSKQVGSEVG